MMIIPQISYALAEIPSYEQHIETNVAFFDLTFPRNIILMFVVPFRYLYQWCANGNCSARIFLGLAEAGLFPGVRISHYVTFQAFTDMRRLYFICLCGIEGILPSESPFSCLLPQLLVRRSVLRSSSQVNILFPRYIQRFPSVSVKASFSHRGSKLVDSFGIGHMEGIGGLHGWQWIVR